MLTKLVVPDDLDFADLALEREPITLHLLFLPAPLAALCRFNDLDPAQVLTDQDLACWLITEWYYSRREVGGEPDPVAEQILEEVAVLEATGIAALQSGSGLPN